MITIRMIDESNQTDLRLKNNPFPLYGRMIPSYTGEQWRYTVEQWEETSQMCFPEENYDFASMKAEHVSFAAYDEERCVGLIVLKHDWFKYLYVEDLKVCEAYRQKGIGRQLIQASLQYALSQNYRGLHLVAQDNNLAACLFYIRCGFRIGGLNTEVYNGTSQAGKKDILFFLDG